MTQRPLKLLLAALLSALIAATGSGCGTESESAQEPVVQTSAIPEEVVVKDGWVRATEGTDDPSMTAAFMSINNYTAEVVTLTGASADVAGMTQIHEMAMGADGAMVMQEIEEGLPIKSMGHAHLEPGGNHVMLMDLQGELAPGDEVTLTLEFDNGETIELTLPVKEFSEEEGHYHSDDASPSASESSM